MFLAVDWIELYQVLRTLVGSVAPTDEFRGKNFDCGSESYAVRLSGYLCAGFDEGCTWLWIESNSTRSFGLWQVRFICRVDEFTNKMGEIFQFFPSNVPPPAPTWKGGVILTRIHVMNHN